MSADLILRTETELPADARALLHGPPTADVWHVGSQPRLGNPFRFATAVTRVLLLALLALFVITAWESGRRGRLLNEGFFITLSLVVVAAGMHGLCARFKAKALRLEADMQAGRVRFGLWLTPTHVLVHDHDEGIRGVARQDIAQTHVYHSGRPPVDLLIFTLTSGQPVRVLVNALTGRAGKAEALRAEVDAWLQPGIGITAAEVWQSAALYLKHQRFGEFAQSMAGVAERLKLDGAGRAALLTMADAALAEWPDEARGASEEWFIHSEIDGTYEYGVNNAAIGGTTYHGFKTNTAHWLLPLCRTVYFHEGESIFPDIASVQDCATTFQAVPLTVIHLTGGMADEVFDAFLAWAATKPLRTLVARDYSTARNSVSDLSAPQRQQLAEFKQQHHLP